LNRFAEESAKALEARQAAGTQHIEIARLAGETHRVVLVATKDTSLNRSRKAGIQEDSFVVERLIFLPSCFPAFLNRILDAHKRPHWRHRSCAIGRNTPPLVPAEGRAKFFASSAV
jgi:hypothetical protein